jgi:2-polyprenyl-3-methyl-5-hydroxy-6-metoxy-1,4-benzoquinol methylase
MSRGRSNEPRPSEHQIFISDVQREWDSAAAMREEQIARRQDLSFHLVLMPAIDRLARASSQPLSRVLDAGCGTGYLTQHLARDAAVVVGVDVSPASIDIARRLHSRSNIQYVCESVEEYAAHDDVRAFSHVLANMVLTATPDLSGFMRAVARVLTPGGSFVFTVPHPFFWPEYWGYRDAPWFRYEEEISVEAPFKISLAETSAVTTHFHRPLASYLNALGSSGLAVVQAEEPLPGPADAALYPQQWRFPRFLAVRATKLLAEA